MVVTFVGAAPAYDDKTLYLRALTAARRGDTDFAYMDYRFLLREYPNTKYKDKALLAQAEYTYMVPDYTNAVLMLQAYLAQYPKSDARLFVLAYLYQIAQAEKNDELGEQYRKAIIDCKQVSLVFRDRKEYKFQSPLGRKLKAVFAIDSIEFSANGELLTKISY